MEVFMQDFNEYVKSNKSKNEGSGSIFDMVKSISQKYDGKSEAELYSAVIEEAKKRKALGTLKNSDVDKFVNTLSPFLDAKKKKILYSVAEKIKEI